MPWGTPKVLQDMWLKPPDLKGWEELCSLLRIQECPLVQDSIRMQVKGFQGGQIQQVREEEDKVVPLRPDLRGEIQGSSRHRVALHNSQSDLVPRSISLMLSVEQDQPMPEG